MKILLINSNPVVSRLTALSARKEEIQVEEVQNINEITNSKYDILFVDSDSFNTNIESSISKDIKAQKRVLFYSQDDKISKDSFDITILKPFLPSEVSAVIRSVEESDVVEEKLQEELEEKSIFDSLETLDDKKEKKEEQKVDDFLLSLDDELSKSSKEKEEDLFAQLKDNSNDFDKQLKEAFPPKKDEDLFDLNIKDDALDKEFDLLDKKKIEDIKIDDDDLFDFNLDLEDKKEFDLNLNVPTKEKQEEKPKVEEKVKFIDTKESKIEKEELKKEDIIEKYNEPPKKVETKKVEESEILNIKDILEDDNDSTTTLDNDLISPDMELIKPKEVKKQKEKKSKRKKVEDDTSLPADTVFDTLASLPVDTLKRLLSGATIKISIKFPKVK